MSVQHSSATFQPSGVITLTTDFGHHDPFVGVMKGVILSRFARAQIIDITHEIAPQQVEEAAFWLSRSYRYFPPGSVHLAIVDPGVGSTRRIIVHDTANHLFIAPDNGLLAPTRASESAGRIVAVSAATQSRVALPQLSATFHGRDIFAPLAAALAGGAIRVDDLGSCIDDMVELSLAASIGGSGEVVGRIVSIDHYGNLITNIDRSLLAAFHRPVLRLGERSFDFVRTYCDADAGEYRALVNAFEVVELARSNGSAAAGLRAGRGTAVCVYDHKSRSRELGTPAAVEG